jgi:hypothetical protein
MGMMSSAISSAIGLGGAFTFFLGGAAGSAAASAASAANTRRPVCQDPPTHTLTLTCQPLRPLCACTVRAGGLR